MDILAHSLWGMAAAKLAEGKIGKKLNLKSAAWWGAFPDLFAFALPFVQLFVLAAMGDFDFRTMGKPEPGSPPVMAASLFAWSPALYDFSHSLFVFAGTVALVVLWRRWRKPGLSVRDAMPWTMGAWLLHILCDIPTHEAAFYGTPFLWPLSDYKFDGISWGESWFMLLNYGTMALVWVFIFVKGLKKKKPL